MEPQAMTTPPPPHAAYIGDGVYTWVEHGTVWVSTERDMRWLHIALEPCVMASLIAYAKAAYWTSPEQIGPHPDRSGFPGLGGQSQKLDEEA
jgi:hypothetical protein